MIFRKWLEERIVKEIVTFINEDCNNNKRFEKLKFYKLSISSARYSSDHPLSKK
jgi:hypothetical protein